MRRLHAAALRLTPTMRGMLWIGLAGALFIVLNTSLRELSLVLPEFEAAFLRYFCGLLVLMPFVLRQGIPSYRPNGLGGQLWRGLIHTSGMLVWFAALPHIPLADTVAIGFTSPLFIMLGAALFLGERMIMARWIATLVGFVGVLIVVGPKMSGSGGIWNIVMLASSPLFAASFLITKALTRRDRAEVIVVWQSITISMFTLPLALTNWIWPTPQQWLLFAISGVLGSAGHYAMTRAFRAADISAIQPVRFLDLIYASAVGYLVFADVPSQATVLGGMVIFISTTWIARREARR